MNMEMPKEKKVTLTIFPDGRVCENHEEKLWGHGKDCIPWKAVPVSPHGRLKDYDQIIKEYDEWFRNTENREYENMFYMLQNELRGAPTIIPSTK